MSDVTYDPGVEVSSITLLVTIPVPHVTEEPPEEGLLHPAIGYLVCFLVLAIFGVAIGVICFRHYRKKGSRRKLIALPLDEENLVSFQNDAADEKTTHDEPVKTVVLKRNGKDTCKKNDTTDDSEDTPMLATFQASESLSDSIEVELLKYTKKNDDLPMIDECEEMEESLADDNLKERLCENEPLQELAADKSKIDTKSAELTHTPPAHDHSTIAAHDDDRSTDSGDATDDVTFDLGDDAVRPRNKHINLERETLTESQVLEILDDAEEEKLSDEVNPSLHVTSADVHVTDDVINGSNTFTPLPVLTETEEPSKTASSGQKEPPTNETSRDTNSDIQDDGSFKSEEPQRDDNKNSNNCNTHL